MASPRLAAASEAPAIADLWLRSRRAAVPAIPPPAYSDAEVHDWFASVVVPEREVWVIDTAKDLVALLVLDDQWIDQLYVDPSWWQRGLGSQLVELAKAIWPSGLDLWTFQSNVAAQRFYERHGFVAVETSDGNNEERAPDVHYRWTGNEASPRAP